jgi:hypothetical protein
MIGKKHKWAEIATRFVDSNETFPVKFFHRLPRVRKGRNRVKGERQLRRVYRRVLKERLALAC